MCALPAFDIVRPASAADVVTALAAHGGARLVAGGTDLLPNLHRGLDQPSLLIDLGALAPAAIGWQDDGAVSLPAGLTLAALAADAGVQRRLPALADAAGAVAGPAHRSAATLGGNLCQDTRCVFYNQSAWWRAANQHCLKRGGATCHVAPQGERCHAAFCSDLAPVLLALDAEIELLSVRGTRRLPLHAFYRDDGAAHLVLDRDELVMRVRLPAAPPAQRCGWRKARLRSAIDFPLAAVAVALVLDAQHRVERLRIGLSGTNSRPLLLEGTDALAGSAADEALAERVARLVQHQASPMRSTVTPANYRRQVAVALTRRLLRELGAAEGCAA